jgi:enterochelin esterase-like enzyme
MAPVSAISAASWLDGTPEWAWPGRKPALAVAEPAPAAWVPSLPAMAALPVRVERPVSARVARPRPQALPRPLRLARLALLIAVAGGTFALSSGVLAHPARAGVADVARERFDATLASPFATPAAPASTAEAVTHGEAPVGVLAPLPEPVLIGTDSAGSAIASITYDSDALGWRDRFLVYLPPGYRANASRRYPVLYLLHGYQQQASSFLRLGVQPTLDRLIRSHTIAPMIAVMLQGSGSPEDWLNAGGPRYYSYVGEVQRLTDRVLPTIPDRGARAIAGYSMGGWGAMNVALTQLRNYSVVESWEGDFVNLSAELAADRSLLHHLALRAFVWGGEQDAVVDTALDAPWAAAMRANGALAQSAVYPGQHSFAPIEAHLARMLSFAGRALQS